jgi:hypothetical protein
MGKTLASDCSGRQRIAPHTSVDRDRCHGLAVLRPRMTTARYRPSTSTLIVDQLPRSSDTLAHRRSPTSGARQEMCQGVRSSCSSPHACTVMRATCTKNSRRVEREATRRAGRQAEPARRLRPTEPCCRAGQVARCADTACRGRLSWPQGEDVRGPVRLPQRAGAPRELRMTERSGSGTSSRRTRLTGRRTR